MSDRDVVDAIDELVKSSLDNYDQRSGYDYNVNQDQCPHEWCSEPWHGLAITQTMRQMRSRWHSAISYFEDEERVPDDVAAELDAYRYDQDDSPVLCPGSTFDGEFEPPEPEYPRGYTPGFLSRLQPGEWIMPEFQFPRGAIVRTWDTSNGWREIGTVRSFSLGWDQDGMRVEVDQTGDESRVTPMPQLETSEPAGESSPVIDMESVYRLGDIRIVTPWSLDSWYQPNPSPDPISVMRDVFRVEARRRVPGVVIEDADLCVDECEMPSETPGMVDLAVTWWPNSIAAEFADGPVAGAYHYCTDIADRAFLYLPNEPVQGEIVARISDPHDGTLRYRRCGWNTETRRWVYRFSGLVGVPVAPSSLDDWRLMPTYDDTTAEAVNNALGATGEAA
ncbi:hypothetical protein [Nocardia wallacei]|uniref:hypothetical protein n=1 Tax=Nocardia wallacei TaxID=480035 RepID=UPI00245892BF|nr:hypothetical protein [Nocardia wallacei]